MVSVRMSTVSSRYNDSKSNENPCMMNINILSLHVNFFQWDRYGRKEGREGGKEGKRMQKKSCMFNLKFFKEMKEKWLNVTEKTIEKKL